MNLQSAPPDDTFGLPTLPETMVGRPFGTDEAGRPVGRTKGSFIRAAVEYMLECVAQRTAAALPPHERVGASESAVEVAGSAAQAKAAALEELLRRLNAAIPDPRYHVNADYLMNQNHIYSIEFSTFLGQICRDLSGDPRFSFNAGARSVPASLALLVRPFSLSQTYRLVPRFTAKMADTDLRVGKVTPTSAVIQFHIERDLARLPEALHPLFTKSACESAQGALASIPCVHSGLPMAKVKELRCRSRGDAYCEWEFTWETAAPRMGWEVWSGAILSAVLLGYTLGRFPGWQWAAAATALFPAWCGWLLWRTRRLADSQSQAQRLLSETRDSAEKQFDEFQKANADLQLSNITLNQKLSELTTLHEIGVVLSSTLDLGELLDKTLNAVTTHLCCDRAMILLVEERDGRRVLAGGHNIGGTPEMAALTKGLEVSLEEPYSFLAKIVLSGKPIVVRDIDEVIDIQARQYLEALQTRAFVAVPLLTQGKPVGYLGLDNAVTGRPLPETIQELLSTIGAQIATGIDRARLYQTLERRVEKRTAELVAATLRAEEAAAAIAQADREKEVLLAQTQESERRLTDIIDFLPDATLVIDAEGRVIAWNRAMEQLTNITAGEMLGKGDYEYAIPFYSERRPILIDLVLLPREELEEKYAHIERKGSVLSGETYTPALKEGGRFLYATASALHNARGEVVGAIETIRDITERKEAEVELQKAKAAAEAATQAKSAFLATMSHEIRTPMNAIIGMSGLLLNTSLDQQQQEFAEIIRASGDALLTIINDILDFSKIEAGKMELEYAAFDLRQCLESAVDLLAARAAEKKLDLAVEIGPNVPQAVVGDVTRLRQILINLLNNAVKFTERGEVVLTVAVEEEPLKAGEEKSVTLHFAVRDTGIGIPEDRLEVLFRSFSQVDASTSRKYGGTGLGLAISRRLSEMMGGTMWVESIAGQGSIFHFTIRAEPSLAEGPPRFRGEQPRLAGRRLLVVDDNPTNRRIVILQTQDWGMIARQTGSPAEALGWIRQGDPFDLAIVDMHMPGMDGIELAKEIRKLRDAKSLPLVMLSSLGGREADAEEVDWAAYLTKPIKQSQLFNVVAGIFGRADERPARPAPQPPKADAEMAARCPLQVLLAEDNAFNQKLALHLLGQLGYRADLAVNGLEAVRSLERRRYDVILMDVQMPEMDGLEASRRICARWPRELRPHIIAMTANAMQGDREMCLAAGMDDYLSKPIRLPDLVAALERAAAFKHPGGGN